MAKKKDSDQKVVVSLNDEALKTIASVKDELKSKGLDITMVLQTSGIIIGSISSSKIEILRKVKGVADVEPDGEMNAI